MTKKPVISIATGCYNEVENIPLFYQRVRAVLERHPEYDYEFVVADNCSTDGTRDVLRKIAAADRKFKVILNTLMSLHEASRPEIFEKNWSDERFGPLTYLYGLFCHTINDERINRARLRMAQVLDTSVTSQQAEDNDEGFVIHQGKVIDLSKQYVMDPRLSINQVAYKLGFQYPQHFTRLFKQQVGMTPSEYRQ